LQKQVHLCRMSHTYQQLRLGIAGLGHLGKIHLRCALETTCWLVVGFVEQDDAVAAKILAQYPDLERFADVNSLSKAVDAVDIVTPTPSHFALAKQAIKAGKHVFIEKPITHTVAEARTLVKLKNKHGVQVQVGHVERFNPAFLALAGQVIKPRFVEIHRLAMYQPRGTDVSVVLDLMIHDLDLLLHLMGHEIRSVAANGVQLLSSTEDIANARITMRDGSVANLTASRISLKQMRKVRIFQDDAYISLDFLEKEAQIVRMYTEPPAATELPLLPFETGQGLRYIGMEQPEVAPVNAIKEELIAFHKAIVQNEPPLVTAEDGLAALALAHRIIKAMRQTRS
jgi:predicted dehydrogenase